VGIWAAADGTRRTGGPPCEIFSKDEESNKDKDVTEKTIVREGKSEEFDSAKLRNYELGRLRWVALAFT